MTDEVVLLLEGVCKTFPSHRSIRSLLTGRKPPGIRVLDGLDLNLSPGSITAVIGPNGAGKTTLLRIITGALLAHAGSVSVMGTDPSHHPARTAVVTGFMTSAERSFYWRLSVLENLRFFGKLQGLFGQALEERIGTVLGLTGCADITERRFGTLSTGYRQRLSLARALLHDPPMLLLDEPTRSLDPETADAFRDLIVGLAGDSGRTVLMATHSRDDAAVCHRVLRLSDGKLHPLDLSGGDE